MDWWRYVLSMLGAIALMLVIAPLFILLCYMCSMAVWKIFPNGSIKNFLFKERGGAPAESPLFIPPWVRARWIKAMPRTKRIAPPPEFISAEEFNSRKDADTQHRE